MYPRFGMVRKKDLSPEEGKMKAFQIGVFVFVVAATVAIVVGLRVYMDAPVWQCLLFVVVIPAVFFSREIETFIRQSRCDHDWQKNSVELWGKKEVCYKCWKRR